MPSNRYPLIAREAWPILCVLLGLTVLAQFLAGLAAFIVSIIILLITVYLFRDPNREIP